MSLRRLTIHLVRHTKSIPIRSESLSNTNGIRASNPTIAIGKPYTWIVRAPPPRKHDEDREEYQHSTHKSANDVKDRLYDLFRSRSNDDRRRILNALRSSFRARIQSVTHEFDRWLTTSDPIEHAKGNVSEALKTKLREVIQSMIQRIDKEETIMRAITQLHTDAKEDSQTRDRMQVDQHNQVQVTASIGSSDRHTDHVILLYHPSSLSSPISSYLQPYLSSRLSHHTLWSYLCIVLLPLSACAAILPGPNIFFAWNAYRLYGHYKAKKGVEQMIQLCRRMEESKTTRSRSKVDERNHTPTHPNDPLYGVRFELIPYEEYDLDIDALMNPVVKDA